MDERKPIDWDDDEELSPDEWDVVVLEMTPEERHTFVPSVYWMSRRGKAVAVLLRAQGRRRCRKPAADWVPPDEVPSRRE
jgi:hypothetical protein